MDPLNLLLKKEGKAEPGKLMRGTVEGRLCMDQISKVKDDSRKLVRRRQARSSGRLSANTTVHEFRSFPASSAHGIPRNARSIPVALPAPACPKACRDGDGARGLAVEGRPWRDVN
ncbi:hypothetical protein A0H81_11411 [Grifola frondosa]|uniref:Uncharacterized protein n=1 Tax=Grifola frondosa TaxID=5627 RepID=A0A1C7LWW9_GRIFR|nr:hypothetical protein A0H81_11411 [Grifola frondosa]